jgi:Fic family protein
MKPNDFQPEAPGELVSTTFTETRNGQTTTRTGWAFVPAFLPPKIDTVALRGRLYHQLERAATTLARLDNLVGHLPSPRVLLTALRAREAQTSSRIENTFASLDDIAFAALQGANTDSQASEVRRNQAMIEAGLDSNWPIGRALLRQMHKVLIVNPDHHPGEFRRAQVCIGQRELGFERARFVPPPATHIEPCLDNWESFVNGGTSDADWPELLRLGVAHYQFETIHPFDDGNGRLGRALVNITPVRTGYLKHPVCNLSEWLHNRRDAYYDGLLRVSTHGDWEGWLTLFCAALSEQARADLTRAEKLAALMSTYKARVIGKRQSALPHKLIDLVFIHQVMTITWAAELLGVTYAAARKHVETLVMHGVLASPVDTPRYGKVYFPREIIDTITGPDG